MEKMVINSRQGQLLETVIRKYVQTAQPVASDLMAKAAGLNLSSATIRNEMKDLEEAGYLAQKHTSGGRVPTDKAYRWFVNNLLANENLEPTKEDRRRIKTAITHNADNPDELNRTVAETIQKLSDQLVIASSSDSGHFYKVGLTSLFEFPEFKEIDRIFGVTSFFEDFERMFDNFEREFFRDLDESLTVAIGKENPFRNIKGETVIMARYELPNEIEGSLTMIGPTRMDYEKNIGLIKYTLNQLKTL